MTKPQYVQNDYLVNPPAKDHQNSELQFGNTSLKGKNWIGGPTENLKAQHVPGYAGFIP